MMSKIKAEGCSYTVRSSFRAIITSTAMRFTYVIYDNSIREYFLNIAESVKLKSKDRRTQIGAVIVGKDNEIVTTGYNSFPRGINDDVEERQQRPEKYFWFEHAERNAIYNAARIGVSLRDTTMYLTCLASVHQRSF